MIWLKYLQDMKERCLLRLWMSLFTLARAPEKPYGEETQRETCPGNVNVWGSAPGEGGAKSASNT